LYPYKKRKRYQSSFSKCVQRKDHEKIASQEKILPQKSAVLHLDLGLPASRRLEIKTLAGLRC
jgi:hypothetical protein